MFVPSRSWPEFLVLTPSHHWNSQLAIAALRARAIGILDLGFGSPLSQQVEALEQLHTHASENPNWGIRWDVLRDPTRLPATLKARINRPVPLLVLAGWDSCCGSWEEAIRQGNQVACRVIAEVCSFPEALAAQETGCAGVILKGHEAGGHTGSEAAFLLLQDAAGKLVVPCWFQGGIGPLTASAVSAQQDRLKSQQCAGPAALNKSFHLVVVSLTEDHGLFPLSIGNRCPAGYPVSYIL
jgi:hypothetical protein